jgi:hypothetical protein
MLLLASETFVVEKGGAMAAVNERLFFDTFEE